MRYFNLFRLFNAAVLLALLAILVPLKGPSILGLSPSTPALAIGENVTLSVLQGAISQEITVTGNGFFASNTTARGVIAMFGKFPTSNVTMDYSNNIYQRLKIIELKSPPGNGTFSDTFFVPSRLDSGTIKQAVLQGTYYVFFTYYYADQNPPLDGPDILAILPFTVGSASITISPTSGPIGTEVGINGTFMGIAEPIVVRYDGVAANTAGDADTNGSGAFGVTRITIPAGPAGPHDITVAGVNTGISAQASFTVKPAITASPASGAAGSTIVLKGSGFTGGSEIGIKFDNETLTPGASDVNGNFAANAVALKRAPGNYTITATDKNGNSATATFTVTSTSFNINLTTGAAGATVTASGSNFAASRAITVTFDGAKVAGATTDAQGSFSVNFTVPSLPGATYKVQATDGTNSSAALDFVIPATAGITPQTSLALPGNIGDDVSVSGSGFRPGGTVTVTYDGRQVATTTVNADKSFSASFKVPASSAGEHVVVASDGVDSKPFKFFMESTPPPTPAPLKPEMNAKAKPEAFFDWADVTDPSGVVAYTLQVATKDDFSAGSIVLEKTGLTGSDYTVPGEQKLAAAGKNAPYYWRVIAVDGAGNQGIPSGTGVFTVGGGLPQPVIFALIGVGVLIVIFLAFWLGKRSAYF